MGTIRIQQKKGKKASKGTVSLQQLVNTSRLKYRYQRKVFYLTIPAGLPLEPSAIKELSKIIELDIIRETHDNSLQRYKQWLRQRAVQGFSKVVGETSTYPPIVDHHSIERTTTVTKNIESSTLPIPSTATLPVHRKVHEVLKDFLESTARSLEKDIYYNTYRMVVNWGDTIQFEDLPKLLGKMNYANKTYNNRKLVLKDFGEWLVRKKLIPENPMLDLPRRRNTSTKPDDRKALTDEQIREVLEAIRTDRFLNPSSHRYTHSYYYPIFLFLSLTGVRPAEAIGLKVEKIDWRKKVIVINEVLARSRKGTSSINRVWKGTKMDDSREIPFAANPELNTLLLQQVKHKKMGDLVFPGPGGGSCDDRKLNESVLAIVLKGLGIAHRILYALRHSFITRCFREGMDVKSVQAITGHKDVNVLLNIYAEVTKDKVKLPKMKNQLPSAILNEGLIPSDSVNTE